MIFKNTKLWRISNGVEIVIGPVQVLGREWNSSFLATLIQIQGFAEKLMTLFVKGIFHAALRLLKRINNPEDFF